MSKIEIELFNKESTCKYNHDNLINIIDSNNNGHIIQ